MRPPESLTVESEAEVGPAFAGHPVAFDLCTRAGRQFVAYYDGDRRLTVAGRALGGDDWERTRLPERVGWDSHNYLALTTDAAGHLHLSGNMHNDPLVYFRTTDPLDVGTFERVDALVGRDEDRVTYPAFLDGPGDELVFVYRDGASGDGRRLLDAFDPERGWRRLLDEPLLDGRGEMNAYPTGPVRGPGGDYHLAWVWRDTPDAATNHDVSYARSPDLLTWERADGRPLALPVTPADDAVVDPVPGGGGLLNSNLALGFDAGGRPVVSYHKFDDDGATQVYNARFGGADARDGWRCVRASDWAVRWEFGGEGSIEERIDVDPVRATDAGLVQPFWHADHGPGRWILDPTTLRPTRTDVPWHGVPERLRRVDGDAEGLGVRWVVGSRDGDSDSVGDSDSDRDGDGERDGGGGRIRCLRWETLPANRDRPRAEVPPPSTLRAYTLS